MSGLRNVTRPSALTRIVQPLPAGDPSAFLELLVGEERGYWGKGPVWTAWGGSLAEIRLPLAELNPVDSPPSRFATVRQDAKEILGWESVNDTPIPREIGTPRWFGGFSFLSDPPSEHRWEGFPEARFILPRVILECTGSTTRLILQSFDTEKASLALEGAAFAAVLEARAHVRGRANSRIGLGANEELDGNAVEGDDGDRERREWIRSVERVLREIEGGRLEKAVLARIRDVKLPARANLPELLEVLRDENPGAHLFLFEPAPDRVFFGAAPELLAELRSGRFSATVVAGSISRSHSSEEDDLQVERLIKSAKDRREHLLTAQEMTETLASRLPEMRIEDEPRVLSLPRIHHLESAIEGRVRAGEDILSLVEALHPTPAVCGRPRDEALACIREAERFDRGWYAGPIGWFDMEGEGGFVPALRTAVGGGDRWRLFAGAGIVKGSLPEAEWDETTLKFLPALQALRVACGTASGED